MRKSSVAEDRVLEILSSLKIPINRVNYLRVKYMDEIPSPWTPQLESQLPQDLQNRHIFENPGNTPFESNTI